MPTKPTSRPKGRPRYIVRNWSAYDRALRRRGDVTVWISEEAVAAWLKSDKRTAGGNPVYADLAIETVLMVRTVFHLPLRQAEGFVAAVFDLMGISLPVPDHTTLSRRGPGLHVRLPAVPATGPVEILVCQRMARPVCKKVEHAAFQSASTYPASERAPCQDGDTHDVLLVIGSALRGR
jgi:hypothetical protein